MTVAAEMVIPILIGAWADSRLGTRGLFAILGGVLGGTSGIWTLMRMVHTLSGVRHHTDTPGRPDKPKP